VVRPAEAKGMSFASVSRADVFIQGINHLLKSEVEALRRIVKRIDPDILEEIKWNAPSYRYRGEYLLTFNLHETKRIHLVFHNPKISKIKSTLLEGDYVDRRMTHFTDMQDIKANKAEFERVLKQFVKLNERSYEERIHAPGIH
jgi:hypothetical protein